MMEKTNENTQIIIKLRVVLYSHEQGTTEESTTNSTQGITIGFTKVRRNLSGKEGEKRYSKQGETSTCVSTKA